MDWRSGRTECPQFAWPTQDRGSVLLLSISQEAHSLWPEKAFWRRRNQFGDVTGGTCSKQEEKTEAAF